MKERRSLLFGFLLLLTLALATCSNQSQSNGKTVIRVATDSDTAPFTYEENDVFKGYDIDMVKAILKDSKKYKVGFMTTVFDPILTGIDADRCQIAANDFNYNEERAKKYLLSDPISKSNCATTNAEGISYNSLDDLSGKSTEVISGSNYAQALEKWSDENPDKEPIRINYTSSSTGSTTRVQHIENGTIDFTLHDVISSNYLVENQGLNLIMTNITDNIGGKIDGLEYLLFADTDEGTKLQKFINKRIKKSKDDGVLAGLSEQYFGGGFVSTID